MTDPEATAGPAASAPAPLTSEVNTSRLNQDTTPLNPAPRTAVVLTAPPPAKGGASEYEDNDEDDLHSISSQSTRGGHHSDTQHAAWDPFASNIHAQPASSTTTTAPTLGAPTTAPGTAADNQSEVYMPGSAGAASVPFVPPKVVMPFAPMQGPMVDHTGQPVYMPNAGGYGQLPQQPQPTVPPPQAVAYSGVGDSAGRPGMYKPNVELGGEKQPSRCSFGKLYWTCACILFLVPLGLIIGFIVLSNRVKIVAMEAHGVNGTISSPDTKAFLMNIEVKLKIVNKNSVGINITTLNIDTAIPPSYGGPRGAKQLGTYSKEELIKVEQGGEKIIPITIPLRFDADSDPEFKSLMEVIKSCGLVGGGLRPFTLKVSTSALGKVVGKDVAFKTSDSLDVACPIPSDFKSDLLTQLVEKAK